LIGPDIIEKRLAEWRPARDQQNGFCRHALRSHVEEDETDAVVLPRRRIGPHQAEDPVGEIGIGGPDLLAVDDEIIAIAFGAGLQRRKIRSGIRLGIALAPANQASRDLGQVFLLLRVGSVFEECRPEHGDAKRGQRLARSERGHLLAHDLCLFGIETATAIFPGPVRYRPALVAHPLEPDALRLGRECGVTAAPEGIFV
jgi:hypothetical protein